MHRYNKKPTDLPTTTPPLKSVYCRSSTLLCNFTEKNSFSRFFFLFIFQAVRVKQQVEDMNIWQIFGYASLSTCYGTLVLMPEMLLLWEKGEVTLFVDTPPKLACAYESACHESWISAKRKSERERGDKSCSLVIIISNNLCGGVMLATKYKQTAAELDKEKWQFASSENMLM